MNSSQELREKKLYKNLLFTILNILFLVLGTFITFIQPTLLMGIIIYLPVLIIYEIISIILLRQKWALKY